MSRNVSFVEPKLRTALAEALHRGKVDLYISYKNTREDRAEVLADVALAQSYQKAIVTLAQALEKQPRLRYGRSLRYRKSCSYPKARKMSRLCAMW